MISSGFCMSSDRIISLLDALVAVAVSAITLTASGITLLNFPKCVNSTEAVSPVGIKIVKVMQSCQAVTCLLSNVMSHCIIKK